MLKKKMEVIQSKVSATIKQPKELPIEEEYKITRQLQLHEGAEVGAGVGFDGRWITDKYYTKKYLINSSSSSSSCNNNEDYCFYIHSNKIIIIALAPSHTLLQTTTDNINASTIRRVDYQINDNLNRLNNAMTGKGKRGAQQLSETSILCHVHSTSGSIFTVRAGLVGKLLEVNEALATNPSLLTKGINGGGWIAIILPRFSDLPVKLSKLLSEDEYDAKIKERQQQV